MHNGVYGSEQCSWGREDLQKNSLTQPWAARKGRSEKVSGLREEQVEGRGEVEGGVPQVTRAACARGSGMDHFNSIFLRTLCLKK